MDALVRVCRHFDPADGGSYWYGVHFVRVDDQGKIIDVEQEPVDVSEIDPKALYGLSLYLQTAFRYPVIDMATLTEASDVDLSFLGLSEGVKLPEELVEAAAALFGTRPNRMES